MIFSLRLLYAGCTVGLWTFLNSSYTFLEGQRIIQGNSAQHCRSLSQLRSRSASAAREERCSLKASQLSVSQPEAACSTSHREEMAHRGLSLPRSQGSQLDLVHGRVHISPPCPWYNAAEAVLSQRLAGLRWDAEGVLLRDTITLGRLEVLWKGASAGILLCPAEMWSTCIILVLFSHLRSGLRNAKACENKEQKMRKLVPWVSEANALEWWALSAQQFFISFEILDKTGADSFTTWSLYLCLSTIGCVWPSRNLFVNPWPEPSGKGKWLWTTRILKPNPNHIHTHHSSYIHTREQ